MLYILEWFDGMSEHLPLGIYEVTIIGLGGSSWQNCNVAHKCLRALRLSHCRKMQPSVLGNIVISQV